MFAFFNSQRLTTRHHDSTSALFTFNDLLIGWDPSPFEWNPSH